MVPEDIVIDSSSSRICEPCAMCGKITRGHPRGDLFLRYSWQVVCRECGEKYAPDLVACLELEEAIDRYLKRKNGKNKTVPSFAVSEVG